MAKYAVSLYGIGQDLVKDDNSDIVSLGGLTFGPATGGNYTNGYRSHTLLTDSEGNVTLTDRGNPHRCIHDDDWETIIYWNNVDPFVYEECLFAGCTHSIELTQNSTSTIFNQYFSTENITGDGVGQLYYELLQGTEDDKVYENLRWQSEGTPNGHYVIQYHDVGKNYNIWDSGLYDASYYNPNTENYISLSDYVTIKEIDVSDFEQYHFSLKPKPDNSLIGTTLGGWPASRIRAMLNGADDLTNIDISNYATTETSDIHKSAAVYTKQNCLFASLPKILRDNIGRKINTQTLFNAADYRNYSSWPGEDWSFGRETDWISAIRQHFEEYGNVDVLISYPPLSWPSRIGTKESSYVDTWGFGERTIKSTTYDKLWLFSYEELQDIETNPYLATYGNNAWYGHHFAIAESSIANSDIQISDDVTNSLLTSPVQGSIYLRVALLKYYLDNRMNEETLYENETLRPNITECFTTYRWNSFTGAENSSGTNKWWLRSIGNAQPDSVARIQGSISNTIHDHQFTDYESYKNYEVEVGSLNAGDRSGVCPCFTLKTTFDYDAA